MDHPPQNWQNDTIPEDTYRHNTPKVISENRGFYDVQRDRTNSAISRTTTPNPDASEKINAQRLMILDLEVEMKTMKEQMAAQQ